MRLGEIVCVDANFSFQYFIRGGYIASTCSLCNSQKTLSIEIYKIGKLVEQIKEDLSETILAELIENNIVNIRSYNKKQLRFGKYILWNMDALYSIIQCKSCKAKFLSIFGMGEYQPGREQVQFKGIWEIVNR